MPPSRIQQADKQQIMSLLQMNRLDEAKSAGLDLCKRHPGDAEAWFMLGALCERLGQYPEAEQYCRKAVKLQPRNAGAHYNYGIVLNHLGKLDKAARSFRKAIDLQPDLVNAHIQLGIILQRTGQPDAALGYLQRALKSLPAPDGNKPPGIDPVTAKVFFYAGNAHFDCGSLDNASESYRQSLLLNPNDVEAYNNLGNTLKAMGRPDAAISEYRTAISIDPMYAAAYINLGIALRDVRQLDEALVTIEKAVQLNDEMAESHHNLANVLQDLHRHSEAEAAYRRALEIAPDFTEAEVGMGNALLSQGRSTEAITRFRNAVRLDPKHAVAHSCLLFALNYVHEEAPGATFREHRAWGKRHTGSAPDLRHSNSPEPDRKMRVGYVSPDLRSHSVAFFLEPLLAKHSPEVVEVTCYAEVYHPDDVTDKMKSLVSRWRVTIGKSDDDVARMIREDGIDILVDLAGHTQGNRLQVFGRKPAPVQISWLGYPNTSGVPAIDYRLTDAHADPEGNADKQHTERLLRLQNSFLCYAPPDRSPDVGPLPLLSAGYITFGSFNMLAKTSPEVVALWSSILNALPGSRLIMKTRALQDTGVCDRYRELFYKHGITPNRIELTSWTPDIHDHLSTYNRVDIALDPYPYNGTTTSCESLWMGVPVITLEGNCHASRVGSSLLHATGMPELVASAPGEYQRIAIELANDSDRLHAVRGKLREQLGGSPLCDSDGYARDMEHIYREAWKEWCFKQN